MIGPIFINQSVDRDVYEGILTDYFIPEAKKRGWMDGKHYFQQDGTPPHTTNENLEIINRHFGPPVSAHKCPGTFGEGHIWPAYSPDLSPLDFFLWGYIKDKIYKDNPKSIEELEKAITNCFKSVPAEMLHRVIASFPNRLRMVVIAQGGHIENIIN